MGHRLFSFLFVPDDFDDLMMEGESAFESAYGYDSSVLSEDNYYNVEAVFMRDGHWAIHPEKTWAERLNCLAVYESSEPASKKWQALITELSQDALGVLKLKTPVDGHGAAEALARREALQRFRQYVTEVDLGSWLGRYNLKGAIDALDCFEHCTFFPFSQNTLAPYEDWYSYDLRMYTANKDEMENLGVVFVDIHR